MTANQLIDFLQQLPPFAEVFIDCGSPNSQYIAIKEIDSVLECESMPDYGITENFILLGAYTEEKPINNN